MAEKVTNKLWKATDAAGNERLVRGVDAREIEAAAAQRAASAAGKAGDEGAGLSPRDIPSGTVDPNTVVEGTVTNPNIIRTNASNFPVADALARETQNTGENVIGAAGGEKGSTETESAESLMQKSRTELEKEARTLKIDGAGYPNKQSLAEAIVKARGK